MTAPEPTILATSGGHLVGSRNRVLFDALVHHAVELSGVHGRRPKVLYVGTAIGDAEHFAFRMAEAARVAGFDLMPLNLFPMPNVEDVEGTVLDHDVVWVMGGSVANLLAVWRLHGLDTVLRRAWEAGVVLSGVSAGSLCWFKGGATDSFGPELRPLTDALGFLPYGNGVHYDSDPGRRPLMHRLVAEGNLPAAHCTDDGVGLVYHGTRLTEAVTEIPGKGAYTVVSEGGAAVEERIEPRELPPVGR
ncbi:peptidase [Streptomyces abyssalis]|uniref:Peptidase n=1 Tax=Streptomyces abyssalis TaxID=933944 RepID=A0A1E7JNP6_9ACTN|nr:peptidase E [Streptomyces abyssalis]OEU86714.1 peptidase [Streptomyces abyssalis]OEU89899.1 peptidase [Streptomyces abyssalis]OEV32063.1 peptidase [Streptomyces nanshensis]